MKFFFPDSQDLVDPSFDFQAETRAQFRLRLRDDLYAHEIFPDPPFDGLLVSKAIVEGVGTTAKYSLAQRHRLRRLGVREFFRLPTLQGRQLETIGDCGAFSYVREEEPPFTVEEVVEFYDECGFDHGVSLDHVILAYLPDADDSLPGMEPEVVAGHRRRQRLTVEKAQEFWDLHRAQRCRFTPLGVAQGWSPASYADAVDQVQRIGYRRIALGGMVPLKTGEILACLEAVAAVRRPDVTFHLLGVTRCEHVETFRRYGVASFDSTSPLLQAFKDNRDNYHTARRTYTAIRIPQIEGNPRLQRSITAGRIDQGEARTLEQACLRALRAYDAGRATVDEVLQPLANYEQLYEGKVTRTAAYRELLEDRPWKDCPCEVCSEIGVEVVIFRGAERNRRRGFHNLYVFYHRLQREMGRGAARPALTAL
jgi:hypothetical protein